ncbi:glycoside hydrolase family 43 protein [Bacillus sp. SM2101]|uniref:glycoside hydrolase family 43 protein n=1 Tax=Bacillus sp. SM2101 TaxID=2805366 RepID=UPI001BDE800C|nr:glycoside hydrolase family 43 protein [Bacillus sp. SM2101]
MSMITNPILKGFNPDPSILRVGEDYYIATSTFEWTPGVQIHHSKDLKNWSLLTHPLTRKSQLNMIGNPDSGGVWAPCLSYANGVFYLVYTNVKSLTGAYKDTHNYLITAKDIMGPWSEPVYLNSSGFDPSLFHDDDGKKWLLNMVWDHRQDKNPFHGIVMQQYSEQEQRLIGPTRQIFKGTELGCTEAPHLYKKDDDYYLMVAEGGTGYEHAVTIARSKSLLGEYVVDPLNPMLTSRNHADLLLQKAGHASLVKTQSNEWYIVHLCSRPLKPQMRCILGRETAIQKVYWTDDGWLRLQEGNNPKVEVIAPQLSEHYLEEQCEIDHFNKDQMNIHLSALRDFASEEWVSLTTRPGYLRMKGRESLNSIHKQSLLARRQQAFTFEAETAVQFDPTNFQQMAGLVYYYNTNNHYYLYISHDEELGKHIGLISSDKGRYNELSFQKVSVGESANIFFKITVDHQNLQFYYSEDSVRWEKIGPELDASILSDDYITNYEDGSATELAFTGAFIGMAVQDLTGQQKHADFDYFKYIEHD